MWDNRSWPATVRQWAGVAKNLKKIIAQETAVDIFRLRFRWIGSDLINH
jgi:hypothetical protein